MAVPEPRLRVLDAVSDAAHSPNEDAWGSTDSAVWVIDGASSVDAETIVDPVSDGAWIARTADEVFRRTLTGPAEGRPRARGALIGAAAEIQRAVAANDQAGRVPPSAAVAVVDLVGNALHLSRLADVTVVVQSGERTLLFRDEDGQRAEAELARELGGVRSPDRPDVDAELRARRLAEMNQPGGTWVLSGDTDAVAHACFETLPIADLTKVLVMSDGFSRYVDVFGIASSWDQVLERLPSDLRLAEMVSELREAERRDPGGSKYPRLTRHDDATAVLAVLAPYAAGD